jgi:hypothetical protein
MSFFTEFSGFVMSEQSLNGGFKFETFPVIWNRIYSEYESILYYYKILNRL